VTGIVDHPRKITFRNLTARHRSFKSLGNVGPLHEAEAQLDARDAVSNRRNHHPIFIRHSRRFRRGYCYEQHILIQDVVTSDVVRECQRHALGHAAEYDRRAWDSKRRVAVETFDKLLRRLANFEANRVQDLLSPLRQVSMRNETTKAMTKGNQPPSKTFVEVEAKKSRSSASRLPFAP
jgi:hypothetical protein